MKKSALLALVGRTVSLVPVAATDAGKPVPVLWSVKEISDDAVVLECLDLKTSVAIGFDGVYSFFSTPQASSERGEAGELQLHVQITVRENDLSTARPLPPPKASNAFPVAQFDPMIVNDGERERYFSWSTRDPVHLCTMEDAKQLFAFYESLCHALRVETGREPEFHLQSDLRGDSVFELSPDRRARWRLLGGAGGRAGSAALVLTDRPARLENGDEVIGHSRRCECGRGTAAFSGTREKIVQLLAKGELRLYCIMCDGSYELSPEEKDSLRRKL